MSRHNFFFFMFFWIINFKFSGLACSRFVKSFLFGVSRHNIRTITKTVRSVFLNMPTDHRTESQLCVINSGQTKLNITLLAFRADSTYQITYFNHYVLICLYVILSRVFWPPAVHQVFQFSLLLFFVRIFTLSAHTSALKSEYDFAAAVSRLSLHALLVAGNWYVFIETCLTRLIVLLHVVSGSDYAAQV